MARLGMKWVVLLIVSMLLLAGCGLGSSPTVDTLAPTAVPSTPSPAVEPTAAPTATPPPTATRTPIPLPTPREGSCLARAVFGDPAASPYILPYPAGKYYMVTQSYCNPRGGHSNQLAYDFRIPVGADIIAARDGLVVLLWEGTPDSGTSVFGRENNYLFIRHEDGTVAMYAHLKQNSIDVTVGQYVEQGQRVAAAGNSGTGGIPHLHFGVYATWPNQEGEDLPVNFSNAEGRLDERGGLKEGRIYKALP